MLTDKYIPAYVSVVRIRGPFLFGATEKLEHATADVTRFAEIVVLETDANDRRRRHRHPRLRIAGAAAQRSRSTADHLRCSVAARRA